MTRTNRTISSVGGGAPDWDSSKSSKVDITTPYTMTRDGILSVHVSFSYIEGVFSLFINGARVWVYASWYEKDAFDNTCLVRVSTGDVISYEVGGNAPNTIDVTYFPLKS